MSAAGDLFRGERRPRRYRQQEFTFHIDVLRYLSAVLPADAAVIHVPMGGADPNWRKRCAALGALPGAPDLLLFWKGRAFGIELKTPTGILSSDQVNAAHRLGDAGVDVATVRNFKTLELYLDRWKIPLKGRISA